LVVISVPVPVIGVASCGAGLVVPFLIERSTAFSIT
jgi:hypothetical protein